jgi:hypothetical protein
LKNYLNSIFEYKDGNLYWKENRTVVKKGQIAGTINSRGYRHIRVDNKFHQSHRLIWIYFYGDIPDNLVVDHIDRNRLNNNIENLRLATSSENNRNHKNADRKNLGVWKTKNNKYKATFRLNNKRYYLGIYETENEAIEARNNFKKSNNITI